MQNNQNKLLINQSRIDDTTILVLSGYLDAHTAPLLENTISDNMNNQNYNLLVNFSGLDYISSAGLGVFMAHIEELRENGGDIKMSNMTDKVFSVFDLLGFPMLFDIVDTEEQALEKFKLSKV